MNCMGKACPFSIHNLIKIEMTVLHNTLVYDSNNWSTYLFGFALSSGVFCSCVWSDQILVERLYHDIGLLLPIYIWPCTQMMNLSIDQNWNESITI